ncbi:gamma carbonic anhydrase family protein [Mycoplasmatota bacterium]|nr:gamma carbonic anhydrase family protein [Mycoplasmatota bacterium]
MKIHETVFIAEGAKVVGDVTIGKDSSVWFNVVIRSDMSYVQIGKGTNIQDLTCIHDNNNMPTIIGDNVTIGHSAIIHSATIKNSALIGMGAIVLDGAVVEEEALVGAGTVVPPGKVVPKRHLAIGNPMKILRELSDSELDDIVSNKDHYIRLTNLYKK